VKDDGNSLHVAFKPKASLDYAFAALWSKDRSAVTTPAAFEAYVKTAAAELATPALWRLRD
jgi:hypothetical protein